MIRSNRRIIKLFESVPKFDTYSQYSISLEKVFHENSFKNLIKNLKEEKKPKIYSYFNVDKEKQKKNRYYFFKHRRENKKNESKNNLLNDVGDLNNINNKNTINISVPYRNTNNKIKISYTNDDPFRYNPNYDSIMKKIPYVKIIKSSQLNIKRPNTFLTEIGGIAVSSNNFISRNKNSIINLRKKNFDNLKLEKEIYNKKKRKLLYLNEDKNNHSIRFDRYSGRKEKKLDKNPNISYIEPYDYKTIKNNSTNFNKMMAREEANVKNKNKIEGPSVGYYNPHYEYFENRIRNISLGMETKKRNKKFLLKKLWGSYDFRMEYLLIDNKKLNNDILNRKENKKGYYVMTEPNKDK